jgi:DNA polymerase-2
VGLIEGLKHPDDSESVEGFRGARFSRTRHCLPSIVARVSEGREEAKREHNAPLSQALKIIMNAFYGVLGSSGCRFFDTRLASSITLRGHQIMRQTRELVEAQGYEVIYGDTDSTFVWLGSAHSQEDATASARRWYSTSTTGGVSTCIRSTACKAPWSCSTKPTSHAS